MHTCLTATTVLFLAIDPSTPATIYAGTSGGVFKSTNGGANWGAVNTGLTHAYARALAIDPATPTTIYAGTIGVVGDVWVGGVFKSTNGGRNWSQVYTGPSNSAVAALAIDPVTPATLYAGTDEGVFKSTNGGRNWSAINTGLTNTVINALAIDPATSTTVYAGTNAGVFSIQQIPPTLALNYTSGAPGSYFTVTGSQFPPNSATTIAINGTTVGTIPTDASGGLIFLLETSSTTDEGYYGVTTSTPSSTRTHFTLDQEDAVRPQEGTGTVFMVPDGIANRVLYLPRLVQ